MTYTFEFIRGDLQEGSEEAERELVKLKGVSCFLPLWFFV